MNRKLLALPVVALAAGAAVWWALLRNPAPGAHELVLHGNVDIRQVELAFNASGRIDQVLVQEGDRVHKGQLLARIDTTRSKLALDQAKAMTDAQRAQLAKLRAGSRPDEIRRSAAERDAARAAATDARQFYERQLDLVARQFVSQQQADGAKNALDLALERLKVAQAAHRLAVLGPRQEDVAAADAGLAAQQAVAAGLAHDIAQGELLAPAEGMITNRVLEPGDMASPQKTVLTLALTEPVWARVYLPETALGRVPVGAQAAISSDSHPQRKVLGWVGYVSPTAEFTPKSVETPELRTSLVYQARVFACAGRDQLRQGMPVSVTIVYDQPAAQGRSCAGGQ